MTPPERFFLNIVDNMWDIAWAADLTRAMTPPERFSLTLVRGVALAADLTGRDMTSGAGLVGATTPSERSFPALAGKLR